MITSFSRKFLAFAMVAALFTVAAQASEPWYADSAHDSMTGTDYTPSAEMGPTTYGEEISSSRTWVPSVPSVVDSEPLSFSTGTPVVPMPQVSDAPVMSTMIPASPSASATTAANAATAASNRIDSELQSTADIVNKELAEAQKRDDYTEQRRELMTTRSLYYPNTPQYDEFSRKIEQLDRDFSSQHPNLQSAR